MNLTGKKLRGPEKQRTTGLPPLIRSLLVVHVQIQGSNRKVKSDPTCDSLFRGDPTFLCFFLTKTLSSYEDQRDIELRLEEGVCRLTHQLV